MQNILWKLSGIALIALVCFVGSVQAQASGTELDSLQQALRAHPRKDSAYVMLLVKISQRMLSISLDSAKTYEKEASQIVKGLEKPELSFSLIMLDGVLESVAGKEDLGLQQFFKGLSLAEKYDGEEWNRRRFIALTNIGGVFYNQRSFDKAIYYLKRAVKIIERAQPVQETGDGYRGIAITYLAIPRLDSARLYISKAIAVYQAFNKKLQLYQAQKLLADIEKAEGNIEKAYTICKELLPAFQELNLPLPLAEIHGTLGRVAWETGRYQEAQQSLKEAIYWSTLAGSIQLQKTAHLDISEFFESRRQIDSAFYHFKRYQSLDSMLVNQEKNRAIANAEALYKATIKDQQNALLQQENRDIQLQNSIYLLLFAGMCLLLIVVSIFLTILQKRKAFIERQNVELSKLNREVELALEQATRLGQEKRHLISLLSHDLRAPLEIIQLNVGLLEFDMHHTPPELQEIRENARLIHEFSLRIMAAQNIETLDIPLYLHTVSLDEVVRYVIQRFKSLALQKSILIDWVPVAGVYNVHADPFFLKECLANLVSNALKCSPDGSSITLSAIREGSRIILSVRDHGSGSPSFTGEDNPFTQPTKSTASIGYGLYLTQRYVQLMGGKIRGFNNPDGGATLEIYLPEER